MLRGVETLANVKLEVPYKSQKSEEIWQNYTNSGCGLTSLQMVLEYFGYSLNGNQMNALAREVGAYHSQHGWSHAGLIDVARRVGLAGYRINYEFSTDQDLEKAQEILTKEGAGDNELSSFRESFEFSRKHGEVADVQRLGELGVPVIASLRPEYTKLDTSHLVVITGINSENVTLNDPWLNGPNYKLSLSDFEKYWTKRVIVVYQPKQTS